MPAPDPASGGRPSAFTCPHYDPVPGSKRCRQYLDGGACARPDEFMCLEWLKANGHAVPPPASAPEAASAPKTAEPVATHEAPLVGRLTDAHIASFKTLGAETCIELAGGGSLWLVPEYSDANREEISVEHAATLAALCAVFPGARLLALRRPGAGGPATPRRTGER
jgi:hypothetical protein